MNFREKSLRFTMVFFILVILLGNSGYNILAQKNNSNSAIKGIKAGGSFTFGITAQPDHLDPYLATAAESREILFNVFEGLVKSDKNGNLIPAVAESYRISTDSRTYIFKIRNGIKFQNGKAVTSTDVKYSLEKALSLSVVGFDNVKSIEATDGSTVKINLKTADSDFLPYLAVAIVPKGYADEDTHPVGTGPFAFESFTPQQSLVLKRNKYYWRKGFPHLDKVSFKIVSDTNALLLELQAGSIDGSTVYNDQVLSNQLNSNSFYIKQTNSNSVQQLNLNNAFKPFDNIKVRKAISYAVDPDEIIKTVVYGKGVRVGTPIIPGLKAYFDSSLTFAYKKDLGKAKKLLSDAGYPKGFSFTITVPSNYRVHVDTAQVIVNQLKNIGIKAAIKQVDWATWLSNVYMGKQYEATIISVDGVNVSPRSYLQRYVSTSANNFINYKNPEYDMLFKKAMSESNPAKRIELYKQAQRMLSKDAASVYIQDISALTALKKNIAGFTSYPLYVFDASALYYTK
jgi:peptide/nickel transport system substrate-binding protein